MCTCMNTLLSNLDRSESIIGDLVEGSSGINGGSSILSDNLASGNDIPPPLSLSLTHSLTLSLSLSLSLFLFLPLSLSLSLLLSTFITHWIGTCTLCVISHTYICISIHKCMHMCSYYNYYVTHVPQHMLKNKQEETWVKGHQM